MRRSSAEIRCAIQFDHQERDEYRMAGASSLVQDERADVLRWAVGDSGTHRPCVTLTCREFRRAARAAHGEFWKNESPREPAHFADSPGPVKDQHDRTTPATEQG